MAKLTVKGKGSVDDPWILQTPPGTSEYKMYRDESSNPPALVCIRSTPGLTTICGVLKTCTPCSRRLAIGCYSLVLTNRNTP
jgi:hypothetical protein